MTTNKIAEFQGNYRFLSNFYPCSVDLGNITYPSAEHAYQAAKTLNMNVRRLMATVSSPALAKKEGRRITIRPDWLEAKDQEMYSIVYAKFSQNRALRTMLLATGATTLEEGNWWGDKYWGICPAGSSDGQNKLGQILMRVRKEMQQ